MTLTRAPTDADRGRASVAARAVIKRTIDVVGALILLLVFAGLLLLTAAAIKLESPGPVLFRQTRVGKGGRPFALVKFRTMVDGAERMYAELLAQSQDPHWLHLARDPRLTRLGRLLRLSSIDELPQLWNVLRGDMSLVGPRPLIEAEHAKLPEWAQRRIAVRPGMTGLWQVSGRTTIPFQGMLALDISYVENLSLRRDLRILLRTGPTVLSRRGAN